MANRAIIENAFREWAEGTGHISRLFAEDMTWEIVGRSAASRKYPDAKSFITEVLEPFGRRFAPDTPFRPVRVRGIFADGDTVIALWDGAGRAIDGSEYTNTYAWFMRLRDGEIVDGVAFYDSIAFDELWNGVPPA